MRCEQCGRVLKNAHMWQLGGDIHAPASRSMRQLCWECRERAASTDPESSESIDSTNSILAQANEIVREVESRGA